ncbi:hypothetical protein CPB83DRAFT_201136 [Crepidotus variabilis]|uniref:TPR-like protein n=1 Tax=Crepidotus variabilis TaxID=179855 RepID=A0A9P6JS28_9AGAR|nr:hypothetical protein CPB83DRAFT_201136 [Crepidotus variabilis]
MSSPKERHYWTQLRAALSAGNWRSDNPAKAPNGASLSWPELFRKFNKHCKGFQDVADVASHTRELAKFLSENYPDDDEDGEGLEGQSGGLGETQKRGKLGIEGEAVLASRSVEKASQGYIALKELQSSKFDTINLALAYYAYALGHPTECLAHLEKVPQLLEIHNNIPVVGSVRSTAQNSLAPSSYAPSITSYTGSFSSVVDNVTPEVRDGRAWAMIEIFRSLCLQGMSHERLLQPENALQAYGKAFTLLPSLKSEFNVKPTPRSSGSFDFSVFQQQRELWRWVERLLWRAVVMTSQMSEAYGNANTDQQFWKWLACYASCSSSWPSNFRSIHRSTVYTIHIRALVLKHGVLSSSPPQISSNSTSTPSTSTSTSRPISIASLPSQSDAQSTMSSTWFHTARTVVQEYREILTACTKFPSAGHRNWKVEEFVDLCVAIWEAHGAVGEYAGWVIDILWWATRLTFNSSRVLRHMTRLLYLAGDTNLAKRTLKLYIQVVGKAHEASKEGVGEDKDTDDHWVDTLVFGARMLLKTAAAQPGLEGIDDVKEAGKVLLQARTRLSVDKSELSAKVLLAEGIHWSMLAIKGHEPLQRTIQLEAAHTAFQQSILAHSTPSGFYHLSLSFARRGGPTHDLDRSIECAGQAVQGEPKEVKHWHLLGILLSCAEKWDEAEEVLDRGAELDLEEEGDEEDLAVEEPHDSSTASQPEVQTLAVPTVNGTIQVTDFAGNTTTINGGGGDDSADAITVKPVKIKRNSLGPALLAKLSNGVSNENEIDSTPRVLEPGADDLPVAETLLKSLDIGFEGYPPSRYELFECHLQLRMTQVALMEVVEGADGAESGWLDIFSWVAERKGPLAADASSQARQSFDGTRRSMDQHSQLRRTHSSIHLGAHEFEKGAPPEPASASINEAPNSPTASLLAPIPITISPATPDAEKIEAMGGITDNDKERDDERKKKNVTTIPIKMKRSSSSERDGRSSDATKTKKVQQVQQILKDQVHKGRAGITAVSKKIGHGVTKNGGLRKSSSTPDFTTVFQPTLYQASSIHSRRRLSSIIHSQDRTPNDSPPPPPPPLIPAPEQDTKVKNGRVAKENRLLSDLWLMSAATFRRLGKIDQAKGSIQEAEVRDQNNPNVWVQLGLYYASLGHYQHAIDTFQKALFILPDDISATIHLSRLYLDPEVRPKLRSSSQMGSSSASTASSAANDTPSINPNVDLAAGILAYLTKGNGWDVPEAWYYLAKAYGLQGRKEKERETLRLALELSEQRGVRDIGLALGWCL